MAVTIVTKELTTDRNCNPVYKNKLVHHKNPSGMHNKADWLLEQSHRDINEIPKILSSITMVGYDMIHSWMTAATLACDVIKSGDKNASDYHYKIRCRLDKSISEAVNRVKDACIPDVDEMNEYCEKRKLK